VLPHAENLDGWNDEVLVVYLHMAPEETNFPNQEISKLIL
jgi:hypothetical protein